VLACWKSLGPWEPTGSTGPIDDAVIGAAHRRDRTTFGKHPTGARGRGLPMQPSNQWTISIDANNSAQDLLHTIVQMMAIVTRAVNLAIPWCCSQKHGQHCLLRVSGTLLPPTRAVDRNSPDRLRVVAAVWCLKKRRDQPNPPLPIVAHAATYSRSLISCVSLTADSSAHKPAIACLPASSEVASGLGPRPAPLPQSIAQSWCRWQYKRYM
jgi:hypothetical protein